MDRQLPPFDIKDFIFDVLKDKLGYLNIDSYIITYENLGSSLLITFKNTYKEHTEVELLTMLDLIVYLAKTKRENQ